MKILIVTDAWRPQLNGVVRTYENLSRALRDKGHDVLIISPNDFKWKTSLPSYPEIKLCLFPYRALKKKIELYKPEAIHIAVEGPLGWAARKYCRKHKVKYTTSYHTHFPHYVAERVKHYAPALSKTAYRLSLRYVRVFHKHSSTVFTASKSLEQTLRSWDFKAPITRLTRGVDTKLFSIDRGDKFKNLKGPIALYVGRVAIEKNIESFLKMPWDGSKVIVGDGPALEWLKKDYTEAHFLGKKEGADLAACYKSADLFIFPSKTDTFGIVIIEALACGLPVAAYPVTGPKDIITSKDLGALNEDLLSAAHEALKHGSPDIRAQHVHKNYSWDKAADQFLQAF